MKVMRRNFFISLGLVALLIILFLLKNDSVKKEKLAGNETPRIYAGLEDVNPALISHENSKSMSLNVARKQSISDLANALRQYIDETGDFPSQITDTPKHISASGADLCPILVDNYIGCLPRDPRIRESEEELAGGGFVCECTVNYTTGYSIQKYSEHEFKINAPLAEQGEEIFIVR